MFRNGFSAAVRLLLLPLLLLPGVSTSQTAPFSNSETLLSLLGKGELALVESRGDSSLKQVTAIAVVSAPIDVVWARITDYAAYQSWMPKVGAVTVLKTEGNTQQIDWDIEVPGPNYKYTMQSVADKSTWTVKQKQIGGALKGSFWGWQLVSQGANSTLVFRTTFTNVTGESWIATQLDDENQTLNYSINISSALLEVKAVSRAFSGKK